MEMPVVLSKSFFELLNFTSSSEPNGPNIETLVPLYLPAIASTSSGPTLLASIAVPPVACVLAVIASVGVSFAIAAGVSVATPPAAAGVSVAAAGAAAGVSVAAAGCVVGVSPPPHEDSSIDT